MRGPTRREKQLLSNRRLDPAHWLIKKSLPNELLIVSRQNKRERVVTR